jgi:hypothetical protein
MTAVPRDALPPTTPPPDDTPTGPVTESFMSIVIRRTRYVAAIGICGYLFYTLGWTLVSATQAPGLATAALFQGSIGGGAVAALGLLALLIVGIAVSKAIVHPDIPHMGLYCTCLGMAALALRGGSMQLAAGEAQVNGHTGAFFMGLLIESVAWLLILLAADAVSLLLFSRLFKNIKWLERFGSSPATPEVLRQHQTDNTLINLSLHAPGHPPAQKSDVVSSLGALAVTAVLGGFLLFIFARTELKGQTLFACMLSFGLSGFAAQRWFPRTGTWAIWAGVCTASILTFAFAGQFEFPFPGHVGFPPARCLPIDYVAAGIPGAILGYYSGVRWQIHHLVHEQ